MEKKNTMLLTVVAVATLLVAVVGATFAYFTATGNVQASSNATVTTSAVDSVAGGATDCTLAVTGADMRKDDGTAEGVAKTSDACTLKITGTKDANNTQATKCTYDITYTPTNALTIRGAGNEKSVKELSLVGSAATDKETATLTTKAYAETDLYNVTAKTTLVTGATFTFSETTTATWTFNTKFYNYNFDQNALADKTFGGTLAIENISCTAA